ncbi:MAG: hypothetical protein V4772_26950 [Pseudomonadota bacterium]
MKRLTALKAERAAVEAKLLTLISGEFGIRWLFALKAQLKDLFGIDVFNHFCLRARRGDYRIVRVKELTGVELERAIEATGKRREEARIVNEVIGQLPAMGWLIWDFRAELIDAVSEPFKALKLVDGTSMETRELAKQLKVFSGWENRVAEAERLLAQAKLVLSPENISCLQMAAYEMRGKLKPEPLLIDQQGKMVSHQRHAPSYLDGWQKTVQYKALVIGKVPAH